MAPNDNGLKQGMVPGSEATVSGVERHTGAELQEDKPINSELNSKTRKDNDKPHVREQGSLDDSSSSSSSDSESESSESPRSESLDQAQQWSMISVSPRGGAGNFSSELFTPSSMKPPSGQAMGRTPGYDPNRIPSSVFSPGPTTPMDWSAASNESLFSIHMGNNSFSRDHYIMQGDTKHDDWYCNTPLHTNNNLSEVKSNLPPVVETRDNSLPSNKTQAEEKLQEFEKEKLHDARLSVTSSNLSDGRRLSSADGGRHSASAMNHSSESTYSSGRSFAFPLLVGGKSGSFKVTSPKTKEEAALPQPQNQTEAQATTPDHPEQAKSNWFSCIMCWPRCCF